MFYSRSQVVKLFSLNETSNSPSQLAHPPPSHFSSSRSLIHSVDELILLEKNNDIPPAQKNTDPHRKALGWTASQLPLIGKKIGFLPHLDLEKGPLVYSFFVTKGGVFKTALALNMARMTALHGIKTCVVGLDMQCDITNALGYLEESQSESPSRDSQSCDSQSQDLTSAIEFLESTRGLYDLFMGQCEVRELLQPTHLPTLFYIPETPELVTLEQNLLLRPRRELWLQETVIAPLKKDFDLIIFDCSPNWNQLITNALVTTDVLVSPVECKINNFRNLKMFRTFIDQIKKDLKLHFNHFYLPTRLNLTRRLSCDIFNWYTQNLPQCLPFAIRDHIQGEEATALHLSLSEYQPGSQAAREMNQILSSLWLPLLKDKSQKPKSAPKTSRRKLWPSGLTT